MLTKRNKNAIIEKYQADSKDKTKNRRISNKITNKKKKKQELLVFYFAQKRVKSFLKKCRKSVDKEKKV